MKTGLVLKTLPVLFLLVGIALGVSATLVVALVLPGPWRPQTPASCTEAVGVITASLKRYMYIDIIYNLKYIVVLTSSAPVLVMVANSTGSIELLGMVKTSIETAINATDKISSDIDIILGTNTTETERNALVNMKTEVSALRALLVSFLRDVVYAIDNKRIDPSLVDKSRGLFNDVSNTVSRITGYISSVG